MTKEERNEFKEIMEEVLSNKNFATKDDLKNFATKDDLKNFATKDDLKNFATKDDLKNFATKDDLKNFATKDDLKNFATKDDLKNFATKDDLKNFATKDDLKNFATKDDLKNFATKDDFKSLETKMHDYFLLIENNVVPKIDAMYDALCTRVTHEECDKRMGKVEEKATVIDPLMVTVGKHSEKLLEHEERLEKLEALGV